MSSPVTDPAAVEHAQLREQTRAARKEFRRSPLGAFTRAMEAAMQDYHRARAQGVSQADAIGGLEMVLRDAWPMPPSRFQPACDTCDDVGWRIASCWHEQRCGRKRCAQSHPAHEHTYAVPCDCAAGDKFRRRSGDAPPESAIIAAGRTQKRPRSGFSRFGS